MSDRGPNDPVDLGALRARVDGGDVSWLRGQYRGGQLDGLRDHLGDDQWRELGRRLDGGDVVWVRRVLGGLSLPSATAATAWVTEPARAERPPRHGPGAWLVAGASVTAVALLALALSQCRGGNTAASPTASGATTALTPAASSPIATTAVTTLPSITVASATVAPAPPSTTGAATTTTTVAAASSAPGTTTTTGAPTQNLVGAAATAGLTTLSRALTTADLNGTLSGAGPFTLLAPSDAAFAKLPAGTLDALLKDRAALTRALRYHVLTSRVPAAKLTAGPAKTLEGSTVIVGVTGTRVTVNDATVTATDVGATNGVIHVIDTVLLPPGFTVGGVAVTVPPPPVGDVVQVAAADGRFGLLIKALDAAGLTATLQGPGPYTLLAPTDAAFRALPPDLLTKLLADRSTLAKLLTYHVIAGRVPSAALKPGEATTAEGDTVKVGTNAAGLTIDDAGVLTIDVAATNGVLHAIDKVLVPADVNLAALGVPLTPPTPLTLSVYFAPDSAAIRPDAAAAIADAVTKIPAGARVALVGVADSRGDATANKKLSEDRARAVQKAFEAAGLKATFTISAKGSEPATDLQLARRVDITAS